MPIKTILKQSSLAMAFMLTITTSSHTAPKTYGDLTIESIVSVYDGDTFKVIIKDMHPLIGDTINIRVRGVDTPEIRDKDPLEKQRAYEARDYLKKCLSEAKEVLLKDVGRDKYFRIVATVLIDGVDAAELLIAKGLGKPYDGGTKIIPATKNVTKKLSLSAHK